MLELEQLVVVEAQLLLAEVQRLLRALEVQVLLLAAEQQLRVPLLVQGQALRWVLVLEWVEEQGVIRGQVIVISVQETSLKMISGEWVTWHEVVAAVVLQKKINLIRKHLLVKCGESCKSYIPA